MDTISLSTDESNARFVVVKSKDGQGNVDHRQGNIDTDASQAIIWEAERDDSVSRFEVTFVNLSTGQPTWPFVELADGTGSAPAGYLGPISLEPQRPNKPTQHRVKLTTSTAGGEKVKYTVAAIPVPGVTITPCDPMLIIRPTQVITPTPIIPPTLISRVTFGLICAIAGAIVGALLASRPWQ